MCRMPIPVEISRMPCAYKILEDKYVVAKKYFGRVTTKCVLNLIDAIEEDPKFREGMMEFADLCDVVNLDISATDISHFADLMTGFSLRKRSPTRKAVYAPHGAGRAAAFGFQKLVEGFETLEVGVFATMHEAIDFLRVDDASEFRALDSADFQIN